MLSDKEQAIYKCIKDESLKDWKETDPDMSWKQWLEDAIDELDTTVKKFKFNVHAKFREAQVLRGFLGMETDEIIDKLRWFYETELEVVKKQEINEIVNEHVT